MSRLGTVGGMQVGGARGERTPGGRAPGTSGDRAPAGRTGADGPPALLPGIPRQRTGRDTAAPVAAAETGPGPSGARPRPWRLLLHTPFSAGYALLLVATSLFAEHADPTLVSRLLQGSSTDVVHLAQAPLLVLVASALWVAGGLTSGYALGFLVVLPTLERRIGGLRTAAVFFGGHALATLATEVPVAFTVAAGGLPESSLHRLDYGISFGVMTCTGALAGVLPAWLRWPLLGGVGWFAGTALLAYADPMTDWGHLLSLTLGVASWPLLRHWRAVRTGPTPLLGDLGHPALRGAGTA
ncbi:rhomboid-like protein [Streptomyces sp. NRRL S-1448]|uniref:rhomboid-like protein n=1 Tax=Streptomyces sp. NRRL S-1448 TaxID=1463883 RepID=UPI001F31D456|nr:rhomboid-like protein [Streptomyces sp. NRRL S-1448]